jgi:heme-binding NEAT domain protein
MFIHLTTEITLVVSLNTVSLDYSFDPASINIECLETLGETLGSDTVPTQEPSTADSTVPNSAQKPNVDQCSDTLTNHSYMYKIAAVAGVLLTVGVGVGV